MIVGVRVRDSTVASCRLMQKTKSSRQANLVVSPSCSDLPFGGGFWRKSLRRTLPMFDFGKSSRNSTNLGTLLAGEFASAEMAHRLGVKRRIVAHDKSLDGFPAGRVRHTDYGAILHTRKPGEHCFHRLARSRPTVVTEDKSMIDFPMDGAPSEGYSTTTILAQLSIEPDAGAAVAVGRVIADRPPHRSRRAVLPHRAPTSDE